MFFSVLTFETMQSSTLMVTFVEVPLSLKKLEFPIFVAINPDLLILYLNITSTPADKSNFINASTVCGVGSIISNNLL